MATIKGQVRAASDAIETNISMITADRGFLSKNVLQYLRDLIEAMVVWAHTGNPELRFTYQTQFDPARDFAKAQAKYRPLTRFHAMLQVSVSHFTLDSDPSERLMLKYYEYLLRTRQIAKDHLGIQILRNLEQFPLDLDPLLHEYHEKIAAKIEAPGLISPGGPRRDRYYVLSSRPFYANGRIYYEVTFAPAHNRTSKFDRIIGFTKIEVSDSYAANMELESSSIDVFGQAMPIILIRSWEVSIRPCEFNNYARFFGQQTKVSTGQLEYRNLMQYLTTTEFSLLDLIDMPDADFERIRTWATDGIKRADEIFTVLQSSRDIIRRNRPGTRILRYLLLGMNNNVVRVQYQPDRCGWLSNLYLTPMSRPFDTMPFCTYPRRHTPRFYDLATAIGSMGREHEFLARRVMNNVEQHGAIYTPDADLEDLGDLDKLVATYNGLLPPTEKHKPRIMAHDKGHVFITGYENDSVTIINELQAIAASGVADHEVDAAAWLDANPLEIDDDLKADALTRLFAESKVALIYGAAGTGKTRMVEHIASYFDGARQLFLAKTNTAVDNLRSRVETSDAYFSTIDRHLGSGPTGSLHYDLLVIDECSTVGNSDLLKVLDRTSFDLLVLVGDVYQIESIEFGNWFRTIRSYITPHSVFELTEPFRTKDDALLTLWNRVRTLDDKIEESISGNEFAGTLDGSLFARVDPDEIVLCLNYDGLYGINNINRFMQTSNPNRAVQWGDSTFKVGDPVLFNETDRFRPVIFNNMKGTITKVDYSPGRITFDVDIKRTVTTADLWGTDLRWVSDTVVQFDVFERSNTDDDDDSTTTVLPFQIAYAVSIHRAQGLEFASVKVVITDANEKRISHSIFYTAITRARQHLKIYWTPETQKRILSRMVVRENVKDEALLRARRGVAPVTQRPRMQHVRQAP
ncbi:AAA family ATPase [Tessaracoccus sp. MC1679]|uniref:ATP-dependent DNA helicase n=1 Tax=Tessaracoccus sp. MC1679 TaxID=2760313 RepID=UPI0016017145|nr:ATP-dependent RecD-like DNA helicase [Tessaracoccus sp. MC1679]MBB1517582.1 AAA family ATPase [Tessaracoccus sp. MC1679]